MKQPLLIFFVAMMAPMHAQDAVTVTTDAEGAPVVAVAGRLTVAGAEILPAGVIMPYAGSALPAGWLWCDGAEYNATTHPDLHAAIGSTYGGATGTFRVPDHRGRVPLGVGQGAGLSDRTLAESGGEEAHALTVDEMPSHIHGVPAQHNGFYQSGTFRAHATNSDSYQGTLTSYATGGNRPHNNMPPFVVMHDVIKH